MTKEQVHTYLELVRRTLKDGGIFLNLNRRKRLGQYDNNPLLYPSYENEILKWEIDPFFHNALMLNQKDPHFIRVERIKKP